MCIYSSNLTEKLPLCHVAAALKRPISFCCSQSVQTFQSQKLSATGKVTSTIKHCKIYKILLEDQENLIKNAEN